jgi:hypothetical protein
MKKKATLALVLSLTLGLLTGCGGGTPKPRNLPKVESAAVFAGGDGTEEHPYVITTPEGLSAVRENLSAHYRLNADIDLSGADWTPIGAFTPEGDSDAERKIPVKDDAFTGVFDGGSHTVSNLVVHESDSDAVGLFACVRDAHIYNLTVDGASADGHALTGAVVGYAYNSRLTAVSLTGANAIVGHENGNEGAENIGGVIGGATNSLIDSCSAKANVVLPDNSGKAGILCGGLEATSVINGYATGTLKAGDGCRGLGGIAGSCVAPDEITNCRAENARITAGSYSTFAGGLVGGVGAGDETAFSRCSAENAEIQVADSGAFAGGVLGGVFDAETDGDAPDNVTFTNCTLSGVTVNGEKAAMVGGGL